MDCGSGDELEKKLEKEINNNQKIILKFKPKSQITSISLKIIPLNNSQKLELKSELNDLLDWSMIRDFFESNQSLKQNLTKISKDKNYHDNYNCLDGLTQKELYKLYKELGFLSETSKNHYNDLWNRCILPVFSENNYFLHFQQMLEILECIKSENIGTELYYFFFVKLLFLYNFKDELHHLITFDHWWCHRFDIYKVKNFYRETHFTHDDVLFCDLRDKDPTSPQSFPLVRKYDMIKILCNFFGLAHSYDSSIIITDEKIKDFFQRKINPNIEYFRQIFDSNTKSDLYDSQFATLDKMVLFINKTIFGHWSGIIFSQIEKTRKQIKGVRKERYKYKISEIVTKNKDEIITYQSYFI